MKFLIFVQALFLLILCFSCESAAKPDANIPHTIPASDETETAHAKTVPKLDAKNFDGYEFTFLGTNGMDGIYYVSDDIIAEEENGDPVNDALVKRASEIYDIYGIKIKQKISNDVIGEFNRDVISGSDAYQGVWCWQSQICQIAVRNALINLYGVPNFDVENEWWDPKSAEAFSIGDKLYFITGELSINAKKDTYAVLFNKKLFNDFGFEYPYKMVYENKWTLDNFITLAKNNSKDLDGDGLWTAKDAYGFVGQPRDLYTYMVGCGITMIGKDKDNYPVLSLYSERAVSVFDKISQIMYDDTTMINPGRVLSEYGGDGLAVWRASREEWFAGDRILFYVAGVNAVTELRNMESPFGVLPLPKYDENQAEYHSFLTEYCTAVGISAANPNLEAAGYTLEAMSAISCNELKTAFYDNLLKRKILRDDESEGILDVIFSTRSYDVGMMYNIGGFLNMFVDLGTKKSNDFTSVYEKKEPAAMKEIEKLIETYRKLGE
ncbi:MAG: hypothetical protein FWD23_16555 [Oscillospiraceae bacterium]|nr:hypothetical protein [Oscillospiraceae bacterium]